MSKTSFMFAAVVLASLTVNPGCRKDKQSKPAPPAKPVDLTNWKADPSLPKPEVTATVEIVKNEARKKVSMKVTATEPHGLTVHDVQFTLKYREVNEQTGEYTYPANLRVPKMIPKLNKGHAVFETPIIEPYLQPAAWNAENDNWEVEITQYGAYYME